MSTNPYGRQSGLVSAPVTPAADGTTKVFSKADVTGMSTKAGEIGDTLRIVKNMDSSQTIYLAETAEKANDADESYPLAPGEALTVLGPAGIGWGGDLYAKGNASAKLAVFSA